PQCYAFFKQQVTPLLKHIHEGNAKHVGKVPKHHKPTHGPGVEQSNAEAAMIQNSLAALDKKLAAAVKDERYEDAGKIRDQIKYLKSKLEG
ncbi:UvrB/UvrC motif-containing protein, partial [Enterococcus casseliflavus]|uniref:UvrB/UvrC motif-containing protein n=1 Tax=Enterococcus casseliflavus TaxID=37734 RepID=UPI003D0C1B03